MWLLWLLWIIGVFYKVFVQNNLRSSIICCLFFWRNINFFCFVCLFFWLTYWSNFISYFIPNQISCSFCSFLNNSFCSSFAASIPVFVAVSINFLQYLCPNFLAKDKKPYYVFSKSWFCWVFHFNNVYPIINVKLRLSLILSTLLAWSVNQASTEENSVLTLFIIVKECGEILLTVRILCLEQK